MRIGEDKNEKETGFDNDYDLHIGSSIVFHGDFHKDELIELNICFENNNGCALSETLYRAYTSQQIQMQELKAQYDKQIYGGSAGQLPDRIE